jgi:broad specificity phosphatase PhoE
MKLLLARHGQSRWQTEGAAAGLDSPLSPLGVLQAHRLGEYLSEKETIQRIVTSNLRRAHATASIVAAYLDLPLTVELGLREFQSDEEGHAPRPVSVWEPQAGTELHPDHDRFRRRVGDALRKFVGETPRDETVLVVAHGGTIGTLLRLLLGTDTARVWTSNTALHSLIWTRDYWLVEYLNRQEHLPGPLRSS